MPKLEFHFDFGSPNAYLAHVAIPQIEAATGERFEYVPVLLGGVFKATNNVSPAVSLQGIRNKSGYNRIETQRFCARYGIETYAPNPHFPVNTLQVMRGAVHARGTDWFARYVDAVYAAMWRQARKMDEPDVIRAAFEAADLPADELFAAMADPDVKQALMANTEASVEKGTFGAPTFYVDDEIFFGKETLWEVVERLSG